MSGFGPRRPHPPPSHPTIARVSPMVPEASLFMSDSRADMDFGRFSRDGSIHEPRVPSNRQRNQSPTMFASNSSSGAMRPMDPPSPHKNLLQGILRPTPDFSRMFDSYIAPPTEREANDEADNPQRIVFSDYVEPLQSRSTVPQEYIEDKRHKQNAENHARPQYSTDFKLIGVESSPVHPEILKVLNWQNEQLKLLQEQVQVLLQSSPQTKHVDKDGCNAEALTPTTTQPIQENPLPNVRSVSSVSTNTSSLWPEIQEGLNKLHDAVQKEQEDLDDGVTLADMRNSEIKVNSSDGGSLRSPQPTLNIDLPDYPGSECSPDLRKQGDKVSWESPVLGESVSMYEEQKNAEVYNDILSQVNRLLGQPPPHQVLGQPPPQQVLGQPPPQQAHGYAPQQQPLGHPPPPQSLGQPPPQQPEEDPARATFNRLRELGISFISPEDLSQPRSQENCNPQDYSNLFLPRASCPSQSIWRDSPDTSLEISSLALKYLDETQLSSLADKHRTRGQATVRSNSRAENNMSMATQQFLNRHGLDSRENRNPLRSLDNSGRTTLQETNQAEMRKNVVPINKKYGDTLQTLQQAQFTQKTGPNPQQAGQYIQQTVQYTQQARQYVQQPEHNTHGARQFAQEGRQYKKHGQYNQVAGHYGQVAEQYNQQSGQNIRQTGQNNQQPGQYNQQPGQYNQQPGQYTQAGHRPQEFGQHFQEDRHYKEAGQYNQDGGHHTQGAGQYKHPIADQQVRNVRIQEPANGLNCTPTGRTNKDIPNRVLDIEAIKRQPKLM